MSAPKPPRRPNLLFVFADQMRGMDMGCAGNRDVITPVLDRLAREGMLCSRHYATTPLCCPNRATLLTGTYPTTHRLLFNDQPMRQDLPSLGTVARGQGYRTGYIGKWHVHGGDREAFIPAGPCRLGFDDFWAVLNCGHDYFDARYYRDACDRLIRQPGYEPVVQTDLALEFLDGQGTDQSSAQPFCLVVSFGPPHNPYEQVPDRYRGMYPDPEALTLRPNCEPIPRHVLDPAWFQRPTTRDYYAQITSLDEQLGRMLDKLEEISQADNTLVVFTSDHGDMMWSQGLLYKCVPYEESANVPLVMRLPPATGSGTPIAQGSSGGSGGAGRSCDTLIGTVDLLPTLCGLMDWPIPPTVQGLDLSASLRGVPRIVRGATSGRLDTTPPLKGGAGGGIGLGSSSGPQSVFMSNYNRYVFNPAKPTPEWRGIRTPRYTYAASPDRKPWLVFDNQADPYQMHNLAADPAAAGLRKDLAGELESWLARIGDPFLPAKQMAGSF